VEGLERASGRTRRIEAVHALPLHKGERRAVLRLVQLDDVAGHVVQVGGRLVQRIAARIRRRVVGFRASRYASLAADADGGIVEQSEGGIRNRDSLGPQCLFADSDHYDSRHAGFGDARDEFTTSNGHVSPLSCQPACLSTFLHGRCRRRPERRRPPRCSGTAAMRPTLRYRRRL